MFTLLLGNKLHLAPIKRDVQKVLDIGTGTVSTASHLEALFWQKECFKDPRSSGTTEFLEC